MLIKIGTTEFRAGKTPAIDEIVYDGPLIWAADCNSLDMVWDDALGSIRAFTSAEILAAKRLQIIEKINAERDRREQLTFPYAGKLIDSDPVSVQRITVASSTASMALSAGVPYQLDWSCADNSLLTLDAMGVLGMMQALGSHGLALHMHSRGLKAAVLASEDPESVDILTGWPE